MSQILNFGEGCEGGKGRGEDGMGGEKTREWGRA